MDTKKEFGFITISMIIFVLVGGGACYSIVGNFNRAKGDIAKEQIISSSNRSISEESSLVMSSKAINNDVLSNNEQKKKEVAKDILESKESVPNSPATTSTTIDLVIPDVSSSSVILPTTSVSSPSSTSSTTIISTPNLNDWLLIHPNVANSIKWQNQPASSTNVYIAPTESNKIIWTNWTQSQKDDLEETYITAYKWLINGASSVPIGYNGLTDEPLNLQANVNDNSVTVLQHVSSDYMWQLYIDDVGFSLAVEIAEQVPWTVTTYSDEALRYLFDSSTMAWSIYDGSHYSMGTYRVGVPILRSNNLPKTAFAPAMWTYDFMDSAHLTESNKLDTIGSVLDWMRLNMWHFFGDGTYGTFDAVWQYRGFSPLSKIINGTIDSNNTEYGIQHWTDGCHGSVGFLNATLRSVNIPVQPVWICGHELAYFITENKYLSHGDDPYNKNTRDAQTAGTSLLIDEATYKNWFTSDLSVNITDDQSPACANIGRKTIELGTE